MKSSVLTIYASSQKQALTDARIIGPTEEARFNAATVGWPSTDEAVSTMAAFGPHCTRSISSSPIKRGSLHHCMPISTMVPDNCVNSVMPHQDIFETPPSRSHRTSSRTFRLPTKAIEFAAYFTAVILLLTFCPRTSEACIFGLNGWHQKSLAEKTERADVVVVAKVISNSINRQGSVNSYSIRCIIKEVTKGMEKMKMFKFPDKPIQTVHGFGSAAKCLSDVKIGRLYIMMLKDENKELYTDYMDTSGPVEEYSTRAYKVVRETLGWYRWSRWSRCSTSCGDNGMRTRTRNCQVRPCSYGTNVQTVPCNRWPCKDTVDVLKKVPKIAEREKRSLEIHGDQVFPRSLNDSGFAMFYNVTFLSKMLRRPRKFTLIEVSEVDTGAPILSITIDPNMLRIGLGRELQLEVPIDMARFRNTTSKTVLIDFNTTHISAYINCKHFIKQIVVEQRWSALTNSNVSVHFHKSLAEIVDFFVITAQHSRPPAECSRDMFEDNDPQARWSSWTICSVSCGIGVQQRELLCEDGTNDCFEAGAKRTETRKCMMLPCSAGRTVAVASSKCRLPCMNDAQCVSDRCVCPRGYKGVYCQIPVCSPRCRNKGVCLSPNLCACPAGYKGADCSRPICYKGCRNNGQCVAPNKCACSVGFRGRRCQHAICITGCQNGGKCIYPNVCSCKYGTYGQYCEKFECYPKCMNGGKCVGFKKCKCQRGFYGKYCHRVKCRHLCFNGGSCTRHGICKCPRGFYGPRCSEKYCERQVKYREVYKPTVKHFYETVVRRCGRRRMRMCREQRLRNVVVHRIIMKPYITCTTEI